MLTLIHVIDDFSSKSGGTSEAVRNIVNSTAEKAHAAIVICNKANDGDLDCDSRVKIKSAKTRRGKYGLSGSFIFLLFREIRFCDHAYIHGVWQWHSIATCFICLLLRKNYSLFPHGMLDSWFQANLSQKIKKFVYWTIFEQFTAKNATAVITTTELEAKNFDQFFKPSITLEKVNVVPLGIADLYQPSKMVIREQQDEKFTKKILFLGRIHPKKGLENLLCALGQLDADFCLTIAGDGDRRYLEKLKTLSKSLGIENKICWLGHVMSDKKLEVLSCSDLFCLPSFQENFGISVVEALQFDIDVLLAKNVQISSLLSNCERVWICDNDVSALALTLSEWSRCHKGVKNGKNRLIYDILFQPAVAFQLLEKLRSKSC